MRQKVLIVDDSRSIRALIEARLKDEPYDLVYAAHGEEGLALAAAEKPDLILLDVEMPDMDGFETCRRLKNDPELAGIPIVFLTGAASTDQRIRGLELGAVDYLAKPFDPAELRARVRAGLRMKYLMDLLAQKAQVDAMTGLWNRRYFEQRLDAELSLARRSGKPVAVLLADVDDFKRVNRELGNAAGDEVLRRVASTIAETVRNEDVVCRYDGDMFALLAPNISTGAQAMSERIRADIEAMSTMLGTERVKVTLSIGAAWCFAGEDDGLVARAEAALLRARDSGANRVELAAPRAAA